MNRPKIAVIDPNTFALIGMKSVLEQVLPIMDVHTFLDFESLQGSTPDDFFHYFVSQSIVVSHRQFFLDRQRKTILLAPSCDPQKQLAGFHSISTNLPEERLVRSLLALEQHAHAHGRNLPQMPAFLKAKVLSAREVEVLSLLAQGKMNKEIADVLNISIATVISHRKNIVEKLGLKTVSALTIYAVMHGYVDIDRI